MSGAQEELSASATVLTVTLNLALDVTYRVDEFHLNETNRVKQVWRSAGGKGVNVARLVAALGGSPLVMGLAGGTTGQLVANDLDESQIRQHLTTIAGETRQTVTWVCNREATVLNEPGPLVAPSEWQVFLDDYQYRLRQADVVVLSGSVPPGVPVDCYASLTSLAHSSGLPVVLDADGEALRLGVRSGPDIVKPNRNELLRSTGAADELSAAEQLRAEGAGAVVATLGQEGLFALTADGGWWAAAPQVSTLNPTGAGDAVVAALAIGLVDASPWEEILCRAVALSSSTVVEPVGGTFEPAIYHRLLPNIRVVPR